MTVNRCGVSSWGDESVWDSAEPVGAQHGMNQMPRNCWAHRVCVMWVSEGKGGGGPAGSLVENRLGERGAGRQGGDPGCVGAFQAAADGSLGGGWHQRNSERAIETTRSTNRQASDLGRP